MVLSFGHGDIVNTSKIGLWTEYIVGYLLGRPNALRNMLVRESPRNEFPAVKHIIKIEVLVRVLRRPERRGSGEDGLLETLKRLFTGGTKQGRADMLRTDKEWPWTQAQRTTSQAVGGPTLLLVHSHRQQMVRDANAAFPFIEEIGGMARLEGKHIVVEIEIFLGKSRNPVKEHLDGTAVEDGEQMRRDNGLVQRHLKVTPIHPRRDLTVRSDHKEHLLDEWHAFGNTPQQEW